MKGWYGKILLAVSLALNIFLLGAAAGGAYMWMSHGPDDIRARPALGTAARLLEPSQRKAFRQALQQARRGARDEVEKARAGRQELAGLLGQPTPDRAAIDAKLSTIRDADIAVRSKVEAAVIDFALGLNPEDREKFIEGLKGRGRMMPRAK